MSTAAAPTSPSSVPVDGDWPCMRCGYNVRGLAGDGRCPECDHGVRQSRLARPLALAPQRWLRRISHAPLAFLLGFFAWVLFEVFGMSLALSSGSVLDRDDLSRVAWAVLFAPTALLLLRAETPAERSRWAGRWLLPIALLHLALAVMAPVLRQWPGPGTGVNAGLLLIHAAAPICFAAEIGMTLWLLQALLARLPSQRSSAVATWFVRVLCVLLGLRVVLDASVHVARLFYLNAAAQPAHYLPAFFGPLADVIGTVAHFALRPMLLLGLPALLIWHHLLFRHATLEFRVRPDVHYRIT